MLLLVWWVAKNLSVSERHNKALISSTMGQTVSESAFDISAISVPLTPLLVVHRQLVRWVAKNLSVSERHNKALISSTMGQTVSESAFDISAISVPLTPLLVVHRLYQVASFEKLVDHLARIIRANMCLLGN